MVQSRKKDMDLLQQMMVLSILSIIQELVLMEEKDTVFSKRKKLLSLIQDRMKKVHMQQM